MFLCLAQSLHQAKFTMIFPSMFIVLYPITLLVIFGFICLKSLQWNHVTFHWLHFLSSLFTRHFNSQYLKAIVSIFFSVFDLMSYCKFQKPMTKPILKEKRALLNKNYEIKCLNTRCFTSMKMIYAKWCYLTYCWCLRHKNIQKIVLHYLLNYCLQ